MAGCPGDGDRRGAGVRAEDACHDAGRAGQRQGKGQGKGQGRPDPGKGALSVPRDDPFPSTYKTPASHAVRDPQRHDPDRRRARRSANGTILVRDGKIVAVGATVDVPAGATVIDAGGKFVTPGIIDDHSHLGVYAAPGVAAASDGNEATKPNTAEVWAEHSVWPQDPQFPRNLAGGVTTIQVLPGSANLFGGRSTRAQGRARRAPCRT